MSTKIVRYFIESLSNELRLQSNFAPMKTKRKLDVTYAKQYGSSWCFVSVEFPRDRYRGHVLVGWSGDINAPNTDCYVPTTLALQSERLSIAEFISTRVAGWVSGPKIDLRLALFHLSMKAIPREQKLEIVANSGKALAPLLQIFSYGESDEERLANVSLDMLEFYAGYDPSKEDLEVVCRKAIDEVKSGILEGVDRCFTKVMELKTRIQ